MMLLSATYLRVRLEMLDLVDDRCSDSPAPLPCGVAGVSLSLADNKHPYFDKASPSLKPSSRLGQNASAWALETPQDRWEGQSVIDFAEKFETM